MRISALIIEDELLARLTITNYLTKYFSQVDVVGEIESISEAEIFLTSNHADLIFLDVQLRDGKGIELLNKIRSNRYRIIFTTAFREYTTEAFEHKAFGYLLKPLDPDDFKIIVNRAIKDILIRDRDNQKITIPTAGDNLIVNMNEIIRCESDSNYTKIFLDSQSKPVLIGKTLKYVSETFLASSEFIRVHRSHLININHLEYQKISSNSITLSNGDSIPVSRSRKKQLKELLKQLN